METAARLPLPQLSRGRFASATGQFHAYTDDGLFAACGVRVAFTERDAAHEHLAVLTGAECTGLVMPHQVHGVNVVCPVDGSSEALEACRAQACAGADAVLMPYAETPVALRFADCLPLILAAPSGAFAVVHCGWRGTVGHIAAAAARALAAETGCDLGECNAYIGPYIHVECFEVGEEVSQRFNAEFGEECVRDVRHVDLGEAVRIDLLRAGFATERIADVDKCTVCNVDCFFSYRAESGTTGRHFAFACRMRQEEQPLLPQKG